MENYFKYELFKLIITILNIKFKVNLDSLFQ